MTTIKLGEITDERLARAMRGALNSGDCCLQFSFSDDTGKAVMEVCADIPDELVWLVREVAKQ